MSKELEALKIVKKWAHRGIDFTCVSGEDEEAYDKAYKLVEQALKCNEPVRLLAENYEHEKVEAKSVEDYSYDKWWLPMGCCPICGEQNPISNNFCGNCGNKLDKFWEVKK